MRKFLILNVKFDTNDKVVCAKSPENCKNCKDRFYCEEMKLSYDPYDSINYCRNNDYRKRD